MDVKHWLPKNILEANRGNKSYAIAILNRKISLKPATFIKLWNGAAVRILVDGGSNRWIKFVSSFCKGVPMLPPNFLIGDLDSITTDSQDRLMKMGCQTIGTPSQDETDFTKSLMAMAGYFLDNRIDFVINIMEFSGRIDHILSQVNTLYKAHSFLRGIDVYLMTKNSLAWLLTPGKHTFNVQPEYVREQRWCSYVPFSGKTLVTTVGLKWDLTHHPVQFGGIVSTSNTYASADFKIECDKYLFWSMATDCDTTNENE